MNPMVSIIIPTLNAEKELPNLLKALHFQRQTIHEIIIIDSASTDRTVDICKSDPSVTLLQILRTEFDHGKTRDLALRHSSGNIVVFLTQDALPANDVFLSKRKRCRIDRKATSKARCNQDGKTDPIF